MHPDVGKVLDKWEQSNSDTEADIVGYILAELCDLEKFEGPNRGYERVHKWISGAPVYLWKSENYEMFYRYELSEPAVIVLHVCTVENQSARDKALKIVEARIDWRR